MDVDDVDRISALPDELLHLILSFVRYASTVTATAALSRRWRHVWTHVRDLSLHDAFGHTPPGHFAGFVDWVLAQRGDADMDSLHITMSAWTGSSGRPSLDKINEWIRYGTQRVVGDFCASIPSRQAESEADQTAVELPSSGRVASISLVLSYHGLRLPAVARYAELTELKLNCVSFTEDAEGRALCDFLSTCCPRLRRLVIERPLGLTQLVLRVEALEELRIILSFELRALDVTAPNLLALKLKDNFGVRVLRITAPRLHKLRMWINSRRNSPDLDVHGLTSIRRLREIQVSMHGQYRHNTDDSFWLLRDCPGVEDVKVSLSYLHDLGRTMSHVVDATLDGAEKFPYVRSMRVKADFNLEHHVVASMSTLLMRFPRLRSLCIELTETKRGVSQAKCFCDVLGKWTDQGQISMEFLEEVKVTGFTGTSEEMDLVSLLLKSSHSVKKMSVSADRKKRYVISSLKQKMEDVYDGEDEDGDDSLQPIHLKLMDISSSNRGHWHFGKSVYTWLRYTEKF